MVQCMVLKCFGILASTFFYSAVESLDSLVESTGGADHDEIVAGLISLAAQQAFEVYIEVGWNYGLKYQLVMDTLILSGHGYTEWPPKTQLS